MQKPNTQPKSIMTEQEYQKVKDIRTDMADVKNRIHAWECKTPQDLNLRDDEVTPLQMSEIRQTVLTNLRDKLAGLVFEFGQFTC